ncbi:MAG: hypothetical protein R3B64_02880 [Candidatus Paceibacterota bacterium]
MQNETRNCQNCKTDFVIETEDFAFYEKIQVPPPTFCPECRMQRRFAFRNQNNLFKAHDSFDGRQIFSLIPDEANVNIVTNEEWFGDTWDGLNYGEDVDFTKPFLQQVYDLHKKTPIVGLNVTNMVDSPYAGNANDLKNCYLVFNAGNNSDCMYCSGIHNSNNCLDGLEIYKSENCYQCFNIFDCNKVFFSRGCVQCSDVWFSDDCIGCMDCFGCVNLRNKQYHIFNKKYDRETYFNLLDQMDISKYENFEGIKDKARIFWNKFPKKYNQGVKNLDCTGSYITKSKNVKKSWLVENGEDMKYVQWIVNQPSKDCYDISVWGYGCELAYEFSSCGSGVFNSKFIVDCWPNIRNTEYSLHCSSVADCFGCSGLRNKQYCILNKQYTKDDYISMVEKIRTHMDDMPYVDKKGIIYKYGEFFPIDFSWYGYNNTLAQEFFPLDKESALNNKYPWYEISKGVYNIDLKKGELEEDLSNVDSSICKKNIECEICGNAYKIMENEFIFLKNNGLHIPRRCFSCRQKDRVKQRLGIELYHRSCMNKGCNNEFETSYAPDRPEIVYCESCYQKEVI